MSANRSLLALILLSALVRLAAASMLGLGNDEAYHFLYAMHPALSYYDHPPVLAWVEMGFLGLSGSPFSPLALRLGFIILFAGSTWLMARIARRLYGPRAGFLAALALNATGYYGLAASTFALPDGPLLFFWLLTIDRLMSALEQPDRMVAWVWVGLAWGGAMLSKYHAVFLPAGTLLLLLLHPPLRKLLTRPGPYLAAALGLLAFSPVLIWNAANGWASFLFQGGRAVGGLVPRPDYLATALVAQLGYFFPWIWIPLVLLLLRGMRQWSRPKRDDERLLLCMAVVPVSIFAAVAIFRPVLPHWGLIGLVSLFPALGRQWLGDWERRPERARRWISVAAVFPLILLAVTLIEYRTGWLQRAPGSRWGLFTARTDPTADLYGWDEVASRLDELGVLDDPGTFLFTRYWYQSAQLAHAIRLRRPVLCYNIDDPRGFAFWSDPDDSIGRDGILIEVNDDVSPIFFYRRWFRGESPLARFTIERGGKPIRRVVVTRLNHQLAAFPYTFSPERNLAREQIRSGRHPMASPERTARRTHPRASAVR
jgi:4-amino-4-deoxy-L-arabinose transferase-like glycosyltransferase